MNESLHLGRIRGISLGVNWTLLPIFLLIAWSLADTLLPSAAAGYASWAYWFFAVLTTAAFYASLLAHELGHALVGRRHGVGVKGIVLWVFGGVAQLEGDTPTPRAELELAAAGPAVSLGIAAGGLATAAVLSALGASPLLAAAVAWLGGINVLLALFNLLPAFPLDGGRILRALLWRHWNDRPRATAMAARIGRFGGLALIAVGAVELLGGGGSLGGIWLAVIGWFIATAAGQQHELYARREQAQLLRVSDAMTAHPVALPAHLTVAEAIERYVLATRFSTFPVVDPDGRVLGLATVRRMAELARERWASTPILAVAMRRDEIVECSPQAALSDVESRIDGSPGGRALVLDHERLVGVLTRSDIQRARSRADRFGAPHGSTRAASGWGPVPQS